MEEFQPGLSFSPFNRAEIPYRSHSQILMFRKLRLHDNRAEFHPGLKISARLQSTELGFSAQDEIFYFFMCYLIIIILLHTYYYSLFFYYLFIINNVM